MISKLIRLTFICTGNNIYEKLSENVKMIKTKVDLKFREIARPRLKARRKTINERSNKKRNKTKCTK